MARAETRQWLKQIGRRLGTILEPAQRRAVLIEALTKLSPDEACLACDAIICLSFVERTTELITICQTLMWAIVTEHWPEEHLSRTREAAAALTEKPVAIFLCDAEAKTSDDADSIMPPVPDYGREPSPTLGERRSMAGAPLRSNLVGAMRDPHPMVIAKILNNPKLTEDDVVFIAAKRPSTATALFEIAKHPRWRLSKRVALSLIHNPALSAGVSLTLLPFLDATKIKQIAQDSSLDPLIQNAAASLLSTRQ